MVVKLEDWVSLVAVLCFGRAEVNTVRATAVENRTRSHRPKQGAQAGRHIIKIES